MANPKNNPQSQVLLTEGDGTNEVQTYASRAVEALRPHAKTLLAIAVALVAVIVAMSIWQAMKAKKSGQATAAFAQVIEASTARVEEAGPQVTLNENGQPEINSAKAEVPTYAARAEAGLAAMSKLEAAYGGTDVARNAALVKAGLLYDAGKFDDAAASYKAFLAGGPPAELAARAREGVGYAIEAKALAETDAKAREAGLTEAAKAFADLEPNAKGSYYGVALYHQGRIAALKGDKNGAIDFYKRSLETAPRPELAEEITSRLSLLGATAPEPKPAPEPEPKK